MEVPRSPENCTLHAVADATAAIYDGDGSLQVLTATTERAVHTFDGRTGESDLRYNLTSHGYTRPVVAELTGDGASEIVVDAFGTVSVIRPDGSAVWEKQLETYTWEQPSVADFDDGYPELAVGIGGDGELLLFEADGSTARTLTDAINDGITWMTTGQADDDNPVEIVVATPEGTVLMVNGANGEQEWRQDFEAFAAVHAFGDGDDDGAPDLVAVSNDGSVTVVDPTNGEIRGQYDRDATIFTHPVSGDLDGDSDDEIVVTYGDGRVVLDATA